MPDPAQKAFLDDLERRCCRYFVEQANATTGLVLDRARVDGGVVERSRNIASIAATGFGLTALCIGAEQKWVSRAEALAQVSRTLHFVAEGFPHEHGWFYHFIDADTGARAWKCELSSIDTALLLGGVLTAGAYFGGEMRKLADAVYDRIDFQWMRNGEATLTHGWKPESGFLRSRWDTFSECLLLYALAMVSRTHRVSPDAWTKVEKPVRTYAGIRYIEGGPLFVHQYPQAWLDLRQTRWFTNSVLATRANRAFCLDLRSRFPKSYSEDVWGISASDTMRGYVGCCIPGDTKGIDGTVVPCAPGGSLMFVADMCVEALAAMRKKFGDRIWGRYGFADAFNPSTDWYDGEVIGIDLGIMVASADNLRTGNVWKWFTSALPDARVLHQM